MSIYIFRTVFNSIFVNVKRLMIEYDPSSSKYIETKLQKTTSLYKNESPDFIASVN
jgi:hypothetical protein